MVGDWLRDFKIMVVNLAMHGGDSVIIAVRQGGL
jgi:hypothetical protein